MILYYTAIRFILLALSPLSLAKQPKTITLEEIPADLKDILVGLALGDLHIRKRCKNTSLHFKQSIKNEPYILYLYTLFQEFCKMSPKIKDARIKVYALRDKIYIFLK